MRLGRSRTSVSRVPTLNRILLAMRSFWGSLTDPAFRDRVEPLFDPTPAESPDLRVLAVLQRDGRLVDFLLEDIESYPDAQIGAAVRDIHRGCRKALGEYFTFEPVLTAVEESTVTVPADFNPAAIRLSGNVSGSPPFTGVLKHHGWRVTLAKLPTVTGRRADPSILAPAEVEVT